MKFWEEMTTYGRDKRGPYRRSGVNYFEQPWWRYLLGRVTYRVWMAIPGHLHCPCRDTEPFGWRLRFELWCTWDMLNAQRSKEHHVFTTKKIRDRPGRSEA